MLFKKPYISDKINNIRLFFGLKVYYYNTKNNDIPRIKIGELFIAELYGVHHIVEFIGIWNDRDKLYKILSYPFIFKIVSGDDKSNMKKYELIIGIDLKGSNDYKIISRYISLKDKLDLI